MCAQATKTGRRPALNNGPIVPQFRGEKKRRYEALIQLRDELMNQVRDLSWSSLSYRKEPGEDQADVGSENFTRDTGLALMTEEGNKVALIQEAIQRLIEGSYGQCVDCKAKIPAGRLDAIPYAKLCVDCKTARENSDNMPPSDDGDELTE
jgi:DnaK suppressor protein